MRTDPRNACANERELFWWAVAHDLIAHPLMALSGFSKWSLRFHDWTSHKAWPRAKVRNTGIIHRTLDPKFAEWKANELRQRKCPFCTTAAPHYHDNGLIYYIYEVEELPWLSKNS